MYWPEGLPRSLTYPTVTVGQLNASAARMYGDRIAVVEEGDSVSFRELHERSCALANALRAWGVREGDAVALQLSNSVWFLVAYYGSLMAGACVSLVNTAQPPAAVRKQLVDGDAHVVITQDDCGEAVLAAIEGTSVRLVLLVPPSPCVPSTGHVLPDGQLTRSLEEFIEGQPTSMPQTGVTSESVAHLAYTGGTTGTSKGVRVLQRNVVGNVTQMVGWRAGHAVVEDGDGVRLEPLPGGEGAPVVPGEAETMFVSPFFHAHALVNVNFLLLCGATVVLMGKFVPARMIELIEQYRATYITGSPAMWHALQKVPGVGDRDLSSMRIVASGAAPMDASTLEGLTRMFPAAKVVDSYGLTEGTCLVTGGPAVPQGKGKLGSVGVPLFDTTIEIRGGENDEVLPAGEHGEIWARGPQVTDGYLHRPEETAEQFVNGWLRTGDVGYLDEEGFLFITDRVKDMLIYKGYNVYPRELEEILNRHPDVDMSAVVGREDPGVGQLPVAFVVPVSGAEPDPEELMAYVAEQVAPYKKVREIHVVADLPTSAAGKILKNTLREQLVRTS